MMTLELGYDRQCMEVSCLILVPERAEKEHGYIVAMTSDEQASAKHAYHALAQMAYYQYQDDELTITTVAGPITACKGERCEQIDGGLAICREGASGQLRLVVCGEVAVKKLLEAANRYCTRWVRLDL